MTYRTVMVYLQAGADNSGVLSVAGDLVEQFDAHVIGISAGQPHNPLYEEGFGAVDVVTEDRAELRKELDTAEKQFNIALEGRCPNKEWRSTITYGPLSDYIAEQARAADLVIIGKPTGGTFFDHTRCVDVGGLVMQSGRPVLLVPIGATSLALRHVIVGWKDAREAQRAISDALPLLRAAEQGIILQICKTGQRAIAQAEVQDVAGWLDRQDGKAIPLVVEAEGSESEAFCQELGRQSCDLLIAGAYGHNRLNEWVFGGLTQDVLLDPECCVLLSH